MFFKLIFIFQYIMDIFFELGQDNLVQGCTRKFEKILDNQGGFTHDN